MSRPLGLLLALAAIAVPVAVAGSTDRVGSQPEASAGFSQDAIGAWFVELSGKPVVEGGSENQAKAQQEGFRKSAKQAGIKYSERYAFQRLWNGLSLNVDGGQVDRLRAMPDVAGVYPVGTFSIPPTSNTSTPDLATALAMTGADVAQNELGLTGEGVKVAVMDTGVDYDHPDLGGCFGPGCRVMTGWDFVGDTYNADPGDPAYNPVPSPDNDPDDCNGHGTHVSGIVGANGEVTGVAPGVTFGAYRVFGCEGSTTDDIMIAAMERALADDMDVLNMSIGDAFNTWPKSPTAIAASRLVKAGMVVVASIGNSGTSGAYSAGAPGVGERVIGVASFDNTHVSLNTFTIEPDGSSIGYGNAAAAPLAPTSGSLPMERTGTSASTADGCNASLPLPDLTGTAALIRRGGCTFYEKASNAEAAGASAVVLYNNAPGRFSPTVAPGVGIPVVAISDTDGVKIDGLLASGPVDMTWTEDQGTFTNPTGGLISSFSSYGLNAELDLKPDIGAPGGLIRSTYPLEEGGYATISGTSMASPHVAGAAAIMLEAHPGINPDWVRSTLQNHADPADWWGFPGVGYIDNVHRQGAGMVDIDDAAVATSIVNPGKLSLGEGTGPVSKTLVVKNSGSEAVTYDLSYQDALSTDGTFAVDFWLSDAIVAFSSSSVTVGKNQNASFGVTITPPTGPPNAQYGGWIVLTPQGGGQVLRVPFAGFAGDYQSIVVLEPTAFGFPLVSRLVACDIVRGLDCTAGGGFDVTAGQTFSMTDAYNVPQVLVHLDHQARWLQMRIRHATSGRDWKLFVDTEFMPRNSGSTSFFAFPFGGTTTNGKKLLNVPDGNYVVEVSALKALGDIKSPADWEKVTSASFTVDRP